MGTYESPLGTKLAGGLKGLIEEMKNTPVYETMAKNAPAIFDLREQAGSEQEWVLCHN